jgi:hypothetical protein
MLNLNIPSSQVSTELLKQLADAGCFVTHYNLELHADGSAEDNATAQGIVATFDHATGLAKDITKRYETAVQDHIDTAARTAGYDNALSACSYAAYPNTYQADGQSFIVWRSACWEYCYAQLALVQAGTRGMPTIEELIAELPSRVAIQP